jgi:hypothetical protein
MFIRQQLRFALVESLRLCRTAMARQVKRYIVNRDGRSISRRDVFYRDGASGMSDMHGNAARVAESEAGAE